MAKYQHFHELPAWNEAARLYNLVLDVFEKSGTRMSGSFRNQLERAALSVSNNIAEGFDRVTTNELISFLAIARGSASEVASMILVIQKRPGLVTIKPQLEDILKCAQSCARQLTGWIGSIEEGGITGKRHKTGEQKQEARNTAMAHKYKQMFYKSIKPDHPLYHTEEARQARGEKGDSQ